MTILSTHIKTRTCPAATGAKRGECDGAPARRVLRKGLAVGVIAAMLCLSAQGALYTFSGSFQNGGVISDNSTIGLTDAHTLSGLTTTSRDIILTVNLSGASISDLTGYIRLGNLPSSPSVNLDQYLTDGTTSFSVDLAGLRSSNPNDTWTLFFADTSPGIENSLVSWSLDITAVPEPTNVALGLFAAVFGVGTLWRGRRKAETLKC